MDSRYCYTRITHRASTSQDLTQAQQHDRVLDTRPGQMISRKDRTEQRWFNVLDRKNPCSTCPRGGIGIHV